MRWSVTIGKVAGTAVRVHVTFVLFLAFIGYAAYQQGGAEAARDSVLFISAIFTCVVLHEFGHILTARRYGVHSPEVTLLPIGGVANVDRMPEKPYQELLIALAGPLVNVVIAAILLAIHGGLDAAVVVGHLDDMHVPLIERLAAVNLTLAAFNMIPAFPMDGGRVLRAALAMWIGMESATRIAAHIGQIFAFGLGFVGLFGHPMLIFVAIFVYMAAAGEAQMTAVAEATRGVRVADAMETRLVSVPRDASVREAVDFLLAAAQEDFPAFDGAGRFCGLLRRADILDALKNGDPADPIAPFVRPNAPIVDAHATLDEAMPRLETEPALVALDEDGRLLGLLTRQSIAEVVMIKSARPDWRFTRRVAHRPA
jgi:Zn-dependent protease/predicted transcriptional regulator